MQFKKPPKDQKEADAIRKVVNDHYSEIAKTMAEIDEYAGRTSAVIKPKESDVAPLVDEIMQSILDAQKGPKTP